MMTFLSERRQSKTFKGNNDNDYNEQWFQWFREITIMQGRKWGNLSNANPRLVEERYESCPHVHHVFGSALWDGEISLPSLATKWEFADRTTDCSGWSGETNHLFTYTMWSRCGMEYNSLWTPPKRRCASRFSHCSPLEWIFWWGLSLRTWKEDAQNRSWKNISTLNPM